jgi:hypothetical protein
VYSGFWFNWVAGKVLRGFIRKSLGGLIPGRGSRRRRVTRALFSIKPARAPDTRAPNPRTGALAVFLALLAFLIPLTARAQSYYYTGKNPMTPVVNDAASAIPCDASALGAIRYNTGAAAFEGCNGVTWADIRNGAIATAAGSPGQVQFNSGGVLGANANFVWDNTNGRLGIGTTSPGALFTVSGSRWGNSTGGDVRVVNSGAIGSSLTLQSTDTTGKTWSLISTGSGASAGAGKLAYYDNTTGTYGAIFSDASYQALTLSSNNAVGTDIVLSPQAAGGSPYELISTANGSDAGGGKFALYGGGAYRVVLDSSGNVGIGTATPGTSVDVNGGVTMEPSTVTLTANNTVLATANRSYFRVTSDNTTAANRIFCFGAGTIGQVLIIEWSSSTNKGEIVKGGNCSAAAGAVPASLSFTTWVPAGAETILQLMYNGKHWIQIAGSANY